MRVKERGRALRRGVSISDLNQSSKAVKTYEAKPEFAAEGELTRVHAVEREKEPAGDVELIRAARQLAARNHRV